MSTTRAAGRFADARRHAALGVLLCLSVAGPAGADDTPGDFDFYVLSLSWSPTFCATAEEADSSAQCDTPTLGFAMHGLWPQYDAGYPEFCEGAGRVTAAVIRAQLDIMPDRGLITHQWRKHGSCSGLAPEDYFELARAAFEAIRIPPEFATRTADLRLSAAAVEAAFAAVNPGLTAEGMAVSCDDGRLEEVRICLTRDLDFRACAEVDARGCRQRRLLVPAPASN
jgi:ribonuclease T2